MLTEDRKNFGVLPLMTVWENILLTVVNLRLGELAQGLRRIGGLLKVSAAREYAERLVREMQVKTTSVDLPIAELSGGNQQKALFARALSAGSRILLLDEPTKGVDAGAKVEIYRVLQSLVDRGMAVIVVSSELPEVIAVSNRIFVMKEGALTPLWIGTRQPTSNSCSSQPLKDTPMSEMESKQVDVQSTGVGASFCVGFATQVRLGAGAGHHAHHTVVDRLKLLHTVELDEHSAAVGQYRHYGGGINVSDHRCRD